MGPNVLGAERHGDRPPRCQGSKILAGRASHGRFRTSGLPEVVAPRGGDGMDRVAQTPGEAQNTGARHAPQTADAALPARAYVTSYGTTPSLATGVGAPGAPHLTPH